MAHLEPKILNADDDDLDSPRPKKSLINPIENKVQYQIISALPKNQPLDPEVYYISLPQNESQDLELEVKPLANYKLCDPKHIQAMEESLSKAQLEVIAKLTPIKNILVESAGSTHQKQLKSEYSSHYYYDQNKILMYNGQWKNGLPHGIGCYYNFQDKIYYEGSMAQGNEHGLGRRIDKNGGVQEDQFNQGRPIE